jgi:hypothetical protein
MFISLFIVAPQLQSTLSQNVVAGLLLLLLSGTMSSSEWQTLLLCEKEDSHTRKSMQSAEPHPLCSLH